MKEILSRFEERYIPCTGRYFPILSDPQSIKIKSRSNQIVIKSRSNQIETRSNQDQIKIQPNQEEINPIKGDLPFPFPPLAGAPPPGVGRPLSYGSHAGPTCGSHAGPTRGSCPPKFEYQFQKLIHSNFSIHFGTFPIPGTIPN